MMEFNFIEAMATLPEINSAMAFVTSNDFIAGAND